jgi:protein TonB
VAAAVAVHAAVLGGVMLASAPTVGGPMKLERMVLIRELRLANSAAGPRPAPVSDSIEAQATAGAGDAATTAGQTAASAIDVAATVPVSQAPGAAAPTGRSAASAAEAGNGDFDYVPRQYLSTVPSPVTDVQVPFPEGLKGEFSRRVQLSLFIDERGVVQRVRIDESSGETALEDAARDTFRQTRFTPGHIYGKPVRSLIRVEVDFEAQRIPVPAPAAR